MPHTARSESYGPIQCLTLWMHISSLVAAARVQSWLRICRNMFKVKIAGRFCTFADVANAIYGNFPLLCLPSLLPPPRLSPSSEARLQLGYKRSVRSSSDPFKRAVYCLLARCDVSDNHPQVCLKTDDYMWLKVCVLSQEHTPHHVVSSLPTAVPGAV